MSSLQVSTLPLPARLREYFTQERGRLPGFFAIPIGIAGLVTWRSSYFVNVTLGVLLWLLALELQRARDFMRWRDPRREGPASLTLLDHLRDRGMVLWTVRLVEFVLMGSGTALFSARSSYQALWVLGILGVYVKWTLEGEVTEWNVAKREDAKKLKKLEERYESRKDEENEDDYAGEDVHAWDPAVEASFTHMVLNSLTPSPPNRVPVPEPGIDGEADECGPCAKRYLVDHPDAEWRRDELEAQPLTEPPLPHPSVFPEVVMADGKPLPEDRDLDPRTAAGEGRAGRLRALELLIADRIKELPSYAALEERQRKMWTAPQHEKRLRSQQAAARRPVLPVLLEVWAQRANAWDTMGLRPGSGTVIFDARIEAHGHLWEASLMVHPMDIVVFVRLKRFMRDERLANAVFAAFNEAQRHPARALERFEIALDNLHWNCRRAKVDRAHFERALDELLAHGAGIVAEIERANAAFPGGAPRGFSEEKSEEDSPEEWQ